MKNKRIFTLFFVFIVITLVSGCDGCWLMDKQYTGPVANVGIIFGGPCPSSTTVSEAQTAEATAAADTPNASQTASNTANPQTTIANQPQTGTVSGSSPTSAGGGCPCSGVCDEDSIINTNDSKIKVQFQMMEANNAILVMTFLTEEMNKKQPKHLHFFKDASRMYKFGATYSLAKPMYAKLKLPPNSRIEPTDSCMIQDEKDGKTIVYIKYSHD